MQVKNHLILLYIPVTLNVPHEAKKGSYHGSVMSKLSPKKAGKIAISRGAAMSQVPS